MIKKGYKRAPGLQDIKIYHKVTMDLAGKRKNQLTSPRLA